MSNLFMNKYLIITITTLLLISCEKNIKSYPIGEIGQNQELKDRIKTDLSEDEQNLLKGGMMRLALSKGLSGSKEELKDMKETVGEVIENQKTFLAKLEEEEIKKEQEAKAREKARKEKIEELGEYGTLIVLGKDYIKSGYEDYIQFECEISSGIENVQGMKFTIEVYNMFDEKLANYTLSVDDPMVAMRSYTEKFHWEYNQFDDDDKKLRSTDFDKLKFVAYPTFIVLESGKKLSLEDI